MPVTEVFEAELEVMELLEYKPIISRGFTCMMHIHTFSDEVTIKDIVKTSEKDEKGEWVEKNKPQFAKSFQKVVCRITPKTPIALEKFSAIEQMGRFTLRDEGKTISVGKVLRYKPIEKGAAGAAMQKSLSNQKQLSELVTKDESVKQDVVFDMETGETRAAQPKLDAIAEGDEDEQ
jgi:hypothetical protein